MGEINWGEGDGDGEEDKVNEKGGRDTFSSSGVKIWEKIFISDIQRYSHSLQIIRLAVLSLLRFNAQSHTDTHNDAHVYTLHMQIL